MQCGCTLGVPNEKNHLRSILFMQNPPAGGTELVRNHWNDLELLKNRPKSFKSSPEDQKVSLITLLTKGTWVLKEKLPNDTFSS